MSRDYNQKGIGIYYDKQQRRNSKCKLDEEYEIIENDTYKCLQQYNQLLTIGDFNGTIGDYNRELRMETRPYLQERWG